MYYLHNQPWAKPDDPEYDGGVHWNLWSVKQPPYNQLAVADHVLLCCPAPEGSRITYEVAVTQVEKASYATKREAWKIMESAFNMGWTFRKFRDAPYNLDRPDSGQLLAFSYDPVRELQVTRPEGWRLRPNGWLTLTNDQVQQVGGAVSRTGQGRVIDPLLRRAVDLRAMAVTREWLTQRGFAAGQVRDTSVGHPYDFEAGPVEAPLLRVEVKGLSGIHGPVFVTAGEVEHALSSDVTTALVIVSDIKLCKDPDGPVGEGGFLRVVEPWTPAADQLKPVQYEYQPPDSVS